MSIAIDIKNKKVLLVGLGILGGGIATAKWLCEKGAHLTITDLKDAQYLKDSIDQLSKYDIVYTLGEHKESDAEGIALVVVNPDVPLDSPYVQYIRAQNIPIENELTLFARECASAHQVAVTGTRGKTTTVAWITHMLQSIFPNTVNAGNSPTNPFLAMADKVNVNDPIVLEVPSFQLELPNTVFKPKIAVITNIYRDHINRHKSEEGYAAAKMNIFANQDASDFLVLNYDNQWTKKALEQKLPQTLWLYGINTIPSQYSHAVFYTEEGVVLRENDIETLAITVSDMSQDFGEHNIMNLMVVLVVARIFNIPTEDVVKNIASLPSVQFRQEKIFDGMIGGRQCLVFNDTTATSPEATIAAIKRFKDTAIYIMGGTNKELEFEGLAKIMNESISPQQVVFLGGSATELLFESLKKYKGWEDVHSRDTLEECIVGALELFKNSNPENHSTDKKYNAIVFSPAAKSFEKFKNEYDRGVQFNDIFARVIR